MKWFAPMGIVSALASQVAAAPPPEIALEAYKLPNGLKVVLHRDPAVPRVAVCVAYHVGAKNERAGRTGFAHFFEHMMFRGTPHVPNYDLPLQEAGVSSNAFTTDDMTVYHETVPTSFLERAIYLEAERMGFLPQGLDQNKFNTEREVVKNERLQTYENVPFGLAEEAILAHVYTVGQPYSWSVIGSMKDLNASSLTDLRRFFSENYQPGNAALCLSGDFESAQAKKLIETYFGPIPAGPARRPVATTPAEPKLQRVVLKDRIQFPRVYLAWPTVASDHPDAAPLDVLGMILGSGEASRLNRSLVRDSQIAQDATAGNDDREIAGHFEIHATATEGKTTAEMEKAIVAEIAKIQKEPPSQAELDRALARFEKTTYASLTSLLGRALVLAERYAQKGDPNYYKEEFTRYFRVTPADLQRVAKQYLTAERMVLDVQPMQPNEKQTAAFLAGPTATNAAEPAITDRAPHSGPDWSRMPPPSASPSFHPPTIVRKTLSNGLDAWIVAWRTLPVAYVRILLPVGAADDPQSKTGLATLTATLLTQGTKTKDAIAITEAFDALGASQTVSVGSDSTQIGVDVLARNLPPALALVGELLAQPRHAVGDFDRERSLQLAELQQGPDDPTWIARRAFRALLRGAQHPYGRPVDGTLESIKGLTLDDVRSFHQAHYASKGAKLLVVGDVDPEAVTTALEASLQIWNVAGAGTASRPPNAVAGEPGVLYLVDKPGAVQSVVRVGRLWTGRKDPRVLAAAIGNRALGGDFLSRINQNLRERNGFTYSATSSFRFLRDRGSWEVGTDVRADATGAALRALLGELDGLEKTKPFTADEIAVNRAAMAKAFPEDFETPSGIVGGLGELAEFDLPMDEWTTYLTRLQATTADEVQKVTAEAASGKDRVMLVVGDRQKIESNLRQFGFREIRLVTPEGASVR